MLSTSLRAVVSQQLLRKSDGSGRVAVHEILINNSAGSAAIREGRISRLNQVIESGRKEGMMSLDGALLKLVRDKVINGDDAYLKAANKKQFEKMLAGLNPYAGASAKFSRSELRRRAGGGR